MLVKALAVWNILAFSVSATTTKYILDIVCLDGTGVEVVCDEYVPQECGADIADDLRKDWGGKFEAELEVDDAKNTTKLKVKGDGFPTGGPVSIWIRIDDTDDDEATVTDIFNQDPLLVGNLSPFIKIADKFPNGLGFARNAMKINDDGKASFDYTVDYNILEIDQIPLVNVRREIHQEPFPPNNGVKAIEGWSGLKSKKYHDNCGVAINDFYPIAYEWVRQFEDIPSPTEEHGRPVLDGDGFPVVLRAPSSMVSIVLFVHTDGIASVVEEAITDQYILATLELPLIP